MVKLEELAQAALDRDCLRLRALAQDLIHENPNLANIAQPDVKDLRLQAAAASLLELLAEHQNQMPPRWTTTVAALPGKFYLVEAAERMKHLRALCDQESPAPLRLRGFLAPPEFLSFA